TFRRRMAILKKHGIPVIPLDAALGRLKAGSISNAETVLTFDDGWASNLSVAAPILEQHGYPACVYLTTEHLTSGNYYVFNVALGYLLLRSRGKKLTLSGVHPQLDGTHDIPWDPTTLVLHLIVASESAIPDPAARMQLLKPIAAALDIELSRVLEND